MFTWRIYPVLFDIPFLAIFASIVHSKIPLAAHLIRLLYIHKKAGFVNKKGANQK